MPAAGACFSEDASLLLLVCSGGWALLRAEGWDGQDAPTYSRLLHIASQGFSRQAGCGSGSGSGSSGAGGPTPQGAPRHVSWQAPGGDLEPEGLLEAELAGGVILSGAMAADRTRVDHYYAGALAQQAGYCGKCEAAGRGGRQCSPPPA